MESASTAAPLPPSTPPIDQDSGADGNDAMTENGSAEIQVDTPVAGLVAVEADTVVEALTPDGREGTERAAYPSVEELVSKARAPVKHEYLRAPKGRTVDGNAGPWSDTRRAADDVERESDSLLTRNGIGEYPAAKVSAEKKSRRAMKKERQLNKKSPDCLCTAVAKTGDVRSCQYGTNCRFNHDIAAFLAKKPADLEGPCPFTSSGQLCPYGLVCRFAGKHDDAPVMVEGEGKCSKTIPTEINVLNKEFQKKLWKNEMHFTKADAQLKAVGLLSKAKMSGNRKKNQETTEDKAGDFADGEAPKLQPEPRTEEESNSDAIVASASACNGPQDRKRNLDLSPENLSLEGNFEKKAKVLDTSESVLAEGDSNLDAGEAVDVSSMDGKTRQVPTAAVEIKDPPVPGTSDHVHEGCGLVKDERELKPHAREKKLIDFRGKVYVAPLTTVGNLPFRRLCKQLGADVTCGEMAMCTNLLQGQASEWALLRRHPSEDLFGVQICGAYPDSVARAAEIVDRECVVDFIDINVGCPIDVVVNKGAGSSLLTKQTRLNQIVAATVASIERPLTVKVRTGYFEGKNCAHNLLPELSKCGATAVTVHGRTRQQRYSKQADWDYISQCAAQAPSSLQVIGNGDIFSYTDWNDHLAASGSRLATCMVARGALIKPWLLTEIKEQRHWDISSGERLELLRDYVRYGLEHWGSDSKGVETTRHFLLEWLSYTHRYIPVELLEVIPQRLNWRPPYYHGRNDLETIMASESAADWVRITEMLLGPVPKSFVFTPKHKSNAYDKADNG